MNAYFNNEIDNLISDYGSDLNGIYIRNPGNKGFLQTYFDDVYSYATSQNLKVGLEGYKNKFDADTADKVDLIITFKDDLELMYVNSVDFLCTFYSYSVQLRNCK